MNWWPDDSTLALWLNHGFLTQRSFHPSLYISLLALQPCCDQYTPYSVIWTRWVPSNPHTKCLFAKELEHKGFHFLAEADPLGGGQSTLWPHTRAGRVTLIVMCHSTRNGSSSWDLFRSLPLQEVCDPST